MSRHKAAPGRIRDHSEPSNKKAAKQLGGSHKQAQMRLCESKNLMSEFWEVAALWKGMGPLQSHWPRTFVTLDAGHLQLQSWASSGYGPLTLKAYLPKTSSRFPGMSPAEWFSLSSHGYRHKKWLMRPSLLYLGKTHSWAAYWVH